MQDLGRWVSGDYRIPLFEEPDGLDELDLDPDVHSNSDAETAEANDE